MPVRACARTTFTKDNTHGHSTLIMIAALSSAGSCMGIQYVEDNKRRGRRIQNGEASSSVFEPFSAQTSLQRVQATARSVPPQQRAVWQMWIISIHSNNSTKVHQKQAAYSDGDGGVRSKSNRLRHREPIFGRTKPVQLARKMPYRFRFQKSG